MDKGGIINSNNDNKDTNEKKKIEVEPLF